MKDEQEITPMGEWMAIEDWARCAELERPGIVFEVKNSTGQSLLTACGVKLPAAPFDWTSEPVAFRPVKEEPPVHSTPLPAPALESGD